MKSTDDLEEELHAEQAGRVALMGAAIGLAFREVAGALAGAFGRAVTEEGTVAALYEYDWEGGFTRKLMAAWREHGTDILRAAGKAEAERVGFDFDFTVDNNRSAPWLEEHGARVARSITTETQRALREQISASFMAGETDAERAKRLGAVAGLNRRQAATLASMREGLLDGTVTEAAVAVRAGKLMDLRASTIARTEGIQANSQGVLDCWLLAADLGVLDTAKYRKRWVADVDSDRTCPVCGPNPTGLHDVVVDLDEAFESPRTGERYMRPPAHPNCRCVMTLTERPRRPSRTPDVIL